MKKIMLSIVAIGIFGGGYLIGNIDKPEVAEAQNNQIIKSKKTHTIDTSKAKIEYFDVENGDFDVIITPKGDRNVSPEWDLMSGSNYKDCYIVGQKKENAQKIWNNAHKQYGVGWSWDK